MYAMERKNLLNMPNFSYFGEHTFVHVHFFIVSVSSSDNKSVSHWIMFDYFFHFQFQTI
jgi:hypothetical protein